MTRIIPRELIRHLEWKPDKQVQEMPADKPVSGPVLQGTASIDALINRGKVFFNDQEDRAAGEKIGLALALQDAYNQMGPNAIVASLPYLIAGKAKADKRKYLWRSWFSALSEENAGIDRNGRLVGIGQGIVLTIHGGGILTPDRIIQAYSDGLTSHRAAKYTDEEFDNLLRGTLPSGESIDLYTADEARKGKIPDPFGRYGVWMTKETAISKPLDYFSKSDFMSNELVIARAGTLEYLEEYFEKTKNRFDNTLGNWHRFNYIDFRQTQGRVLAINNKNICGGLHGKVNLDTYGRFVAVAPEDVR